MLGAEVNVKRDKLPHQVAAFVHAVSQVLDGIDGWQEVGSRRMQRYANRRVPSAIDRMIISWHFQLIIDQLTSPGAESGCLGTYSPHVSCK